LVGRRNVDDKPKSLSSTEKQEQPVSPSKTVSPSVTEEQAAATAVAAAKLSALNNKRDSTARAGERGGEEANASSGTSSTPRADGVGDNVDAVDINARSDNPAESAGAGSTGADDNHEDANSEGASVGLRQRILQPSPPAPVPELKKPVPVPPAV